MDSKELEHISEKASDTYEHTLPGLGKCEEVIEERIDPTDGTPIDHITYKPMVGSRYFFGSVGSEQYKKNFETIDWGE